MEEHDTIDFRCLQSSYLSVYFLATFSNWLQGPYIYRVYSDYGWSDNSIAYLYVTKYAANCLFGLVVGQLADKCGRKVLCIYYTISFSICCLTKLSSNYIILLIGKILSGISTSILYSVFEAWYLNEHMNYYCFPSEWLNTTFSMATVYNGISAILAGVTGQALVEYFNFSPLASSLAAIPFLIVAFFKIRNWEEHNINQESYKDKNNNPSTKKMVSILFLLLNENKILLLLGLIQCLSETVMYVFIFSWTPILSYVGLPLGLAFTSFMIALMFGSNIYKILTLRNCSPQNLLTFSMILASVAFIILDTCIKRIGQNEPGENLMKATSCICLFSCMLYEFSLGFYYPAIGFLRGSIIPAEYRATLTNWFRIPTNIITCICLIITESKNDLKGLYKSHLLIFVSYIILLSTVILTHLLAREFNKTKKK